MDNILDQRQSAQKHRCLMSLCNFPRLRRCMKNQKVVDRSSEILERKRKVEEVEVEEEVEEEREVEREEERWRAGAGG